MPKREFIGDPIDATMSYIQNRNKTGETVSGTTDDDKGDETTDAIPSFINPNDYTEEQLEILQNKVLHPDMSLTELTEKFDYPYTSTSSFLSTFRRENREDLQSAGMYEKFLFPDSPEARKSSGVQSKPTTEDTDDEKERVREYFRNHPNAKAQDAIDDTGVSLTSSQVGGIKGNLLRNGKDQEKQELFVSTSVRNKVEHRVGDLDDTTRDMDFEEQMELLLNEYDRLAQKKFEKSKLSLTSIGEDTLFNIVTGGTLSKEQRKEIFELVVENGGEGANG